MQDLAISFSCETWDEEDKPWGQDWPAIADIMDAAACNCSGLRSLALSGILISSLYIHQMAADAMPDSISRLPGLTSLALQFDKLSSLSQHMTALTALQQLSFSSHKPKLRHKLSALHNLCSLQVYLSCFVEQSAHDPDLADASPACGGKTGRVVVPRMWRGARCV